MMDPDFERMWRVYPRKVGKLDALKAWKQALKVSPADDIVAGAMRYAQQRAGQDPQFTKHPGAWLRAGRWMDEPEQQHLTGAAALREDLRRRIDDDEHGTTRQGGGLIDDAGGLPLLGWSNGSRLN